MPEEMPRLVERLYEAFNRRDGEALVAVCDEEMEFFPLDTAAAIGREDPYVGPAGLRQYLADAGRVWEELSITASEVVRRGDRVLVRGRVYAHSRELGIRDLPVAWIWEMRGGRLVRGEVHPDVEQAARRFFGASA